MIARDAIERRLRERADVDRREAQADLLSGALYTAGSFAFAHAAAIGLLFVFGGVLYLFYHPFLTVLGISSITALILGVDVWMHPVDAGPYRPEYRLKGGGLAGREVLLPLEHQKGVLSGMPLMANVTDPANLAEHTRAQASGIASLLLGGARLLLAGRRRLARIAERSSAASIAALERFATALGTDGLTSDEIEARAGTDPALAAGFALARELKLIVQGAADRRWTIRA